MRTAVLVKESYCYSILIDIQIKCVLPVDFLQIAVGIVLCFGTAPVNSKSEWKLKKCQSIGVVTMEQLTAKEIDGLLSELTSNDKSERTLAASKLGKATTSQDRIIAALEKMVANERDDFVKGIAKASLQSLSDTKILINELQDSNPEIRKAALAKVEVKHLNYPQVVSIIEQMVVNDDDMEPEAQALLDRRQEELVRQQAKRESKATSTAQSSRRESTETFTSQRSNKYPALRTIAGFYRILAFVAGGFAVIVAMILIFLTNSVDSTVGIILALLSLISGAITVITLLAVAEVIYVFIDIEANTRQNR
jgi:hypothetical protein